MKKKSVVIRCAEYKIPFGRYYLGPFPVRHADCLCHSLQHLALDECERTNAAATTRAVLRTDFSVLTGRWLN